jgi:hypothetical protein
MQDQDIISVEGDMVKIIFTKDAKNGSYRDAIYLSKANYESLSSEDIEKMKEERYQNWVSFTEEMAKNPGTPEPEPAVQVDIEDPSSGEYIELNGVKYKKV